MRILKLAVLRYTLGLAACAAAGACNSDGIAGTEQPFVPPLTVQPRVVTIRVGESIKLVASLPSGAGGQTSEVVWRSGSDSIASIGATGLVHGVKSGQTHITATWGGQHASALVTVMSAATGGKRPLCARALATRSASLVPKAPADPCR